MTKFELLTRLAEFPNDAEILVFDESGEYLEEVKHVWSASGATIRNLGDNLNSDGMYVIIE